MNENLRDYQRIESAIKFITENQRSQPNLDDIANHLNLSPGHFQKLFLRWAGLTPKKFLQVLTVEGAKQLLAEGESVLQSSEAMGLSSASRLYDHFVDIEAVTPGEYKSGGLMLELSWGRVTTPFGEAFIAFSSRGVCALEFICPENGASLDQVVERFQSLWSNANLNEKQAEADSLIQGIFSNASTKSKDAPILLCVKATKFQVSVWKALLSAPYSGLITYSDLAAYIEKPSAVRAVASAVAANPIAWLIPCHRVIRRSGVIGEYRWGSARKKALITFEQKAKALEI